MGRPRSTNRRQYFSNSHASTIRQKPVKPAYQQDHLFISYAWEDSALAEWLALKLAAEGYRVWCDKLKLLGGESYPSDIDHAIKCGAYRVLALLSQYSLEKPNPKKERTLALNLARERKIDFLIPLNVDGLRPDQLDWMTSDLTFIAFHSSWAEGIAALLKKLTSVDAPRDPNRGRKAVSDWYASQDVPAHRTERIWSNLLSIKAIPPILHQFEVSFTDENFKRADSHWPFRRQSPTTVWAFASPDPTLKLEVTTKASINWRNTPSHDNICLTDVVSYLVKRALVLHCHTRGMWFVQGEKNCMFFPPGLLAGNKISFAGYRGKKSFVKVVGERVFYRPGLSEKNRYHLSPVFRTVLQEYPEAFLRVSLRLHLTTLDGAALEPAKIVSRRKAICKSWWNHEWLNRLLAVCHWISDGQPTFTLASTPDGCLTLSGVPASFTVPMGIDEKSLQPIEKQDPSEPIIENETGNEDSDDGHEDFDASENSVAQ